MIVDLNAGLVGLLMTYAIMLMGLFQWGVRQSAEVESQVRNLVNDWLTDIYRLLTESDTCVEWFLIQDILNQKT